MKKKINFLVILILVAALAGAASLVKKNQESRSGATFANVEALFLPETKKINVGDKIISTLMIDTKGHLLTGADLKVKYDKTKLSLDSVTVLARDNFSAGLSWLSKADEVLISEIDEEEGSYSLVGTNMEKETTKLLSGVLSVVKLNFTAIASGEAKINLDDTYANVVTGYNSAGSDQELKIEKVAGANYTIAEATTGSTVKCGWCGSSCVDLNKNSGRACATIYMEGSECINKDNKCVVIMRREYQINPSGNIKK